MVNSLNWLRDRIATLAEVMYAPERAFQRRLEGPSYLVPLCILGGGFVLLALLQAPLNLQWARHQMQVSGAPSGQMEAGLALMSRTMRWGAVFVPLWLFFKWLFFATTIWLTCQIFLADVDFSRVLSVVGYSYPPILVRDVAILFILYMQGDAARNPSESLSAAVGLNLFLPRLRLPWSMLAGNINLFEFWFVVLLTCGISKLAASRWRKALMVALPNWLFALLIQFGLVSLSLAVRENLTR